MAIQEGVGSTLLAAKDKDEAGQRQCIRRCEQQLMDASITEDAAQFVVGEIASALRINVGQVVPLHDSNNFLSSKGAVDSDKRRISPKREQESTVQVKRSEEYTPDNAKVEIPAKRKSKIPLAILLLLIIGGAAAGLLFHKNTVPVSTDPPALEDKNDNFNAIIPPIPPEKDEEETTEDGSFSAAVPPVPAPGDEQPETAQEEPKPYSIGTVAANLNDFKSMVLDNQNNLYYINGSTVYSTSGNETLDINVTNRFSSPYLAHDPYNDIVYLIADMEGLKIYNITDLASPELVLDEENCPAIIESQCGSLAWYSSAAPQIAVLKNGALLVPFGDELDRSDTWIINISNKTVIPAARIYSGTSTTYCKVIDDKIMRFEHEGDVKATVFEFGSSSNSQEVELEIEAPYNNCSSLCSKYGQIYFYLDSVGVCCYDINGVCNVLISQESIEVCDYQSLDNTNIWNISVGSSDTVAFYDNSQNCIRMIQATQTPE